MICPAFPRRFVMSASRLASRIRWLFSCACVAAFCSNVARADEPNHSQVTVQSWVVEVSLADESRQIGGKSIGELFTFEPAGKLTSFGDPGLTPEQLIHDIESKKVGRVRTNARLKLPSGQPGSIQVNDTTIDATATASGEKVRLDYRFKIAENDPALRDTVTGAPGFREQTVDSSLELESGKAVMLALFPVRGKPSKKVAVIVQATSSAPPAADLAA